jgi:hypothetical protein
LNEIIESETTYDYGLSESQKRQLKLAGNTFCLFFYDLLGINPFSPKTNKPNPKIMEITIEQIPEPVFQAWEYICDTSPSCHTLLLEDPEIRTMSSTFPEPYS